MLVTSRGAPGGEPGVEFGRRRIGGLSADALCGVGADGRAEFDGIGECAALGQGRGYRAGECVTATGDGLLIAAEVAATFYSSKSPVNDRGYEVDSDQAHRPLPCQLKGTRE